MKVKELIKKILFIALLFLAVSCCKEESNETNQQVTYRLNVTDVGYKMWYQYEDYTGSVIENGIYDSTFIKHVGDTCYFRVQGTCAEDQRQAFNMQILINGVEYKSKSYSVKNVCNSFDYEINFIIKY